VTLNKKRKRILLIVFLLITAIGAGVWWKLRRANDVAGTGPATAKVTRQDLSSAVLATGAVNAQVGAEVRVGARISGKVDHLYANIGDVVEKGQIIAELEKADLEAKVAQRRAELQLAEAKFSAVRNLRPREIEKAQAELAQWQATVDLYEKELARQEELLKQDFTSQQACDRATEQLAVSKAKQAVAREALQLAKIGYEEDLKQATAEVERAKAALADAQAQLSYATITSPISGVIASVSTQEGETVAAGLNAPTFVTVINLGRLQVDTFVDEVDIGNIQVGQKATFTVDAFPAREFEGKVVAIYPKAVIQENVINYDVVVDITSPYENLLRPEMTAAVTISLETRHDVLTVPSRAMQRERGRNIVYVQTTDGVEPREVKVGWREGQWVEVLDGVSEGEAVLLEPLAETK